MGDLGLEEDRPFLPSFAAPLNNPDPNSIRDEAWALADDPAREVLNCIHPTLDSEEKRKDVIEFVQKLIRCNLRLEVFPYGSVPLKTYLPDGDIDLTVLSTPNLDEILPREVLRVLQEEEKNANSEFQLKDTQFIDAEVKLVKCLVQDIVIDISFNQLGGLCTLCFLEQVDRFAGKDHLFKRSIILIKAWCYYESRILGAHHGLISTYALETLVLYIFHVFHASLNGPVEVFYRFLDYYAKFDWDNYCVSLDGPVLKSSLPNLAVETRDNQGHRVLLGAEFRKNFMDMFIVPCKGVETDIRAFNLKNLNIIDPLKENNNLGRSVHKGNYYRIRSAFRYGARRLGKILQLPYNNIGEEIKKFFKNTLQRHKLKNDQNTPSYKNLSVDDMYSRFSNGDFDDYMNDVSSLKNDHNTPSYKNISFDEKTDLELWMERGLRSELVDSDSICLCINNNDNENLSDNLSVDSIMETEFLNSFSDLTGDYDAHIRNLLYGQGCHGFALSTTMIRTSPPTSPYGNNNMWDPDACSGSENSGSQVTANGALTGNHAYLNGSNRTSANGTVRGTGPFIPNMNCNTCKDRPPAATRGRRKSHGPPISNGHHIHLARDGLGETNLVIDANHMSHIQLEWSPKQAQTNATLSNQHPSQVNSTTNGHTSQIQPEWSPKQAHVNATVSNQTHQNLNPNQINSTTNGFVNNPRKLEFGSFQSMPENPSETGASSPFVSSLKLDAFSTKQGRIRDNSFHLKNEEEFPPLSAS